MRKVFRLRMNSSRDWGLLQRRIYYLVVNIWHQRIHHICIYGVADASLRVFRWNSNPLFSATRRGLRPIPVGKCQWSWLLGLVAPLLGCRSGYREKWARKKLTPPRAANALTRTRRSPTNATAGSALSGNQHFGFQFKADSASTPVRYGASRSPVRIAWYSGMARPRFRDQPSDDRK